MLIYVTRSSKWILSHTLKNDFKENIVSIQFIWIK